MMRLIGGKEVEVLFKHTRLVEADDTWPEALRKIQDGIKKQTNQAVARHKLFTQLRQGEKSFGSWFPKVKEQAGRCDWTGYNEKQAARDAMLFQTSSTKLQQKILAEDLDMDKTIKMGLPLEQSKKKVESMNSGKERKSYEKDDRIAKLEEKVRALSAGGSTGQSKCDTCTRPFHEEGRCPARKATCHDCEEEGHF